MKTKVNYDVNNNQYSYISYEEQVSTFRPRYHITDVINYLGEESFLFKKNDSPCMAFTIFDKARKYESETFAQIYLLTYSDILKRKTGKEEICFLPVNELTQRYIKSDRSINEIKELRVEKDYYNNFKTVVPLMDATDNLLKNKESQRQKTVFKGIKAYDKNSYNFMENTPQSNLNKLIEINLRCRANLQPYDPLDYMDKKALKDIVNYVRMNPDKLWNLWANNCKKIDLENIEYHKQQISKYKEQNNNIFNRISEVTNIWHTKRNR